MTKKKQLHELTQKEIANFCGVTQGYISQILNGITKPNLNCGVRLKKLGFPFEIWGDKAKFDEFMQDLQDKKRKDLK